MIRRLWAFLERPAQQFDRCVAFWSAITGTHPSPQHGASDGFLPLLPAGASSAVPAVTMRSVAGQGGVHLGFEADDIGAAIRRAFGLGAEPWVDHDDHTVLRSPSGQPFRFTPAVSDPTHPAPAFRAPDVDPVAAAAPRFGPPHRRSCRFRLVRYAGHGGLARNTRRDGGATVRAVDCDA